MNKRLILSLLALLPLLGTVSIYSMTIYNKSIAQSNAGTLYIQNPANSSQFWPLAPTRVKDPMYFKQSLGTIQIPLLSTAIANQKYNIYPYSGSNNCSITIYPQNPNSTQPVLINGSVWTGPVYTITTSTNGQASGTPLQALISNTIYITPTMSADGSQIINLSLSFTN